MKINRYDDFTKLREVVLGEVNYSPLDLITDENDRDFMRHILDETKSSMAKLQEIFQTFDVKVWRPEVFKHTADNKLGAPYTKVASVYHVPCSITCNINTYGKRNSIKEVGGFLCLDRHTIRTRQISLKTYQILNHTAIHLQY